MISRKKDFEERVSEAREFASSLPLKDAEAFVIGSVARGDFVRESDTDVLVISDDLPENYWERTELLSSRRTTPRIEAIGWRRTEWEKQVELGNPLLVHWQSHSIRLR